MSLFNKPGHTPRNRKPDTTSSAPAEPSPQNRLAAAEAALNTLLAEQADIAATLEQHQQRRQELLQGDGDLQPILDLQAEDDRLKLRIEQIGTLLPDIEREIEQQRRANWEAAWQTHRPALAAAEAGLVQAIENFFAMLERANGLHARARGFGERLREFVAPPPPIIYNDWALREFVKAVARGQRQPAAGSQPMLELTVEAPLDIPAAERFKPRRVSVAEIEMISAIAEPRRVRIQHGPVRTANLNIGISRMFVGEEHIVPARAAHTLVASGVATYADEAETVETATAAAKGERI